MLRVHMMVMSVYSGMSIIEGVCAGLCEIYQLSNCRTRMHCMNAKCMICAPKKEYIA